MILTDAVINSRNNTNMNRASTITSTRTVLAAAGLPLLVVRAEDDVFAVYDEAPAVAADSRAGSCGL